MKTWTQIIKDTIAQKQIRKWDKLYWCIDLHDTIITGKYNKFNVGSTIYPDAKLVLDYLYDSKEHVTTLWTSSHFDSATDVVNRFDLRFNYVNVNPECPNTELCDFDIKFYFNFLLDDKSGFCGETDWTEIKLALNIQ